MLVLSLQNMHWSTGIHINKHIEPIYFFCQYQSFFRCKLVLVTIPFLMLNEVNE